MSAFLLNLLKSSWKGILYIFTGIILPTTVYFVHQNLSINNLEAKASYLDNRITSVRNENIQNISDMKKEFTDVMNKIIDLQMQNQRTLGRIEGKVGRKAQE